MQLLITLKKLLKRGHSRTIVLAMAAAACFVYAAIRLFDVEPAVMWEFFVGSVLGLTVIILLAAIGAGSLVLIRKLFERKE